MSQDDDGKRAINYSDQSFALSDRLDKAFIISILLASHVRKVWEEGQLKVNDCNEVLVSDPVGRCVIYDKRAGNFIGEHYVGLPQLD